MSNMAQAVASHLRSQGLQPRSQWLDSFMSTVRPSTPLLAVQKTALFRLLASDIRDTLLPDPNTIFPSNANDPKTKELRVNATIIVQVLDIEDVGKSRWSQVELLEQQERGEMTKGREIIRIAANEDGETRVTAQSAQATASRGPHRLVLQDCAGTQLVGLELSSIKDVDLKMSIGCKIRLVNPVVARGAVLLEPSNTTVLGGKVDEWDKSWRLAHKEVLKTKARANSNA